MYMLRYEMKLHVYSGCGRQNTSTDILDKQTIIKNIYRFKDYHISSDIGHVRHY